MSRFEDQNVEFKQEYVDDLNKEVIAFANAEGGTVFIGIRKDGQVLGLDDPDDTSQRVANSLKDSILPDIMPFVSIRTITLEGHKVLKIDISPGSNRPYYIQKKGLKPTGVYIRKGSSSQPMTDEGIREMIRATGGTSYEEGRSLNQDLTFLTFIQEMQMRELKIDTPQMQTLHLIGADGLYTNLAYLLSDQCESFIKLALFQGSDKDVFRDRVEFTGSLLKQLEDAYAYIDRMNKTSASFSGLLRTDLRDYPNEALRESLLNSICHRDYGVSASNIINIYDDRIEFISQGGLVSGLSIDSLCLGISKPRNKYLAQLFFRMRLIESYGTGIGKIQRAYQASAKKPLFETAPGVFRVTLPNTYETNTVSSVSLNQLHSANVSKAPKDTLLQEKDLIIEYVQTNEHITRLDVEEMLGVGTTKAYRLLKELCADEILQVQGSGKQVRYVLARASADKN